MAWFEMESIFRISFLLIIAFIPLLVFGLWGLWKQKRIVFILFFACLCLSAIVFDFRVMLTAQLFLLFGYAYWLKKHFKPFFVLSAIIFVLLCFWWVTQKFWYFGVGF